MSDGSGKAYLAAGGGVSAAFGSMLCCTGPLVLAAAAGWAKGRFVLARAAGRVIERIRTRGDGRCIGGFLSLRTWALVALMMVAGRTLRHSFVPAVIVGLAYAAVGTALLVAARRLWQAAYRSRTGP